MDVRGKQPGNGREVAAVTPCQSRVAISPARKPDEKAGRYTDNEGF